MPLFPGQDGQDDESGNHDQRDRDECRNKRTDEDEVDPRRVKKQGDEQRLLTEELSASPFIRHQLQNGEPKQQDAEPQPHRADPKVRGGVHDPIEHVPEVGLHFGLRLILAFAKDMLPMTFRSLNCLLDSGGPRMH